MRVDEILAIQLLTNTITQCMHANKCLKDRKQPLLTLKQFIEIKVNNNKELFDSMEECIDKHIEDLLIIVPASILKIKF